MNKTLKLLIDHELQRIKDAHREGNIDWDDPINVPRVLSGDDAMSSITVPYGGGQGNTTLRKWRTEVVKLQDLL